MAAAPSFILKLLYLDNKFFERRTGYITMFLEMEQTSRYENIY